MREMRGPDIGHNYNFIFSDKGPDECNNNPVVKLFDDQTVRESFPRSGACERAKLKRRELSSDFS